MGQYKFTINGKSFEVNVASVDASCARVNVNGVDYDVTFDGASGGMSPAGAKTLGDAPSGDIPPSAASAVTSSQTAAATSAQNRATAAGGNHSGVAGGIAAATAGAVPPGAASPQIIAATGGSSPAAKAAGVTITSPLPGVVIDVCVKEGESVKRGQKVVVLEAMKMENEILAEKDGVVSAILVKRGDSVLEGAALVKIA